MREPTTPERNDTDLLLAEALTLARRRLEQGPHFSPFAVALRDGGLDEIEVEGHEDANTFGTLLRMVRQRAVDGHRAVALVRHARLRETLPLGTRTPAVVIVIEHVLGHAIQWFVPHDTDEAGQVRLGEPRSVPAIRSVY